MVFSFMWRAVFAINSSFYKVIKNWDPVVGANRSEIAMRNEIANIVHHKHIFYTKERFLKNKTEAKLQETTHTKPPLNLPGGADFGVLRLGLCFSMIVHQLGFLIRTIR